MVNFMPSLVHFILKISTTGKVCKKSWESPGKKKKKMKGVPRKRSLPEKKMKTTFIVYLICLKLHYFWI